MSGHGHGHGHGHPVHGDAHGHDHGDPSTVSVLVVTVSDTRTAADDAGGDAVCAALEAAGHRLAGRHRVPDDPEAVGRLLDEALPASGADAAILTGGTGLTARDGTYEVVAARLDKRLDGFGELFRMLSYEALGARAMLSRAVAGLASGRVIFAIPGSEKAVHLAMDRLIVPVLPHAVGQARR